MWSIERHLTGSGPVCSLDIPTILMLCVIIFHQLKVWQRPGQYVHRIWPMNTFWGCFNFIQPTRLPTRRLPSLQWSLAVTQHKAGLDRKKDVSVTLLVKHFLSVTLGPFIPPCQWPVASFLDDCYIYIVTAHFIRTSFYYKWSKWNSTLYHSPPADIPTFQSCQSSLLLGANEMRKRLLAEHRARERVRAAL